MKLKSNAYTGNQLMNPSRTYVDADHTDIRATFARERERLAQMQQAYKATNVRTIVRSK